MNDGGTVLSIFFTHHIQGILCRIPGMNDNRPADFFCQGHLTAECLFLYIPGRLVPIVIQADFSHSDCFGIGKPAADPLKARIIQRMSMLGMDSHGSIQKRIFFRKLKASFIGIEAGSRVHHITDPFFRKASQKLFPIFIKGFIIVMGMTVKNHYNTSYPFLSANL